MLKKIMKLVGRSLYYRVTRYLLKRNAFDEKSMQDLFSRYNYYFLPKSYYLPIPEKSELLYQISSELVGIDLNEEYSFQLIHSVFNKYKSEFDVFPLFEADYNRFYVVNGSFMAIDGNVYYSLIRHLKPNTIVEIGSGNSTLLASSAIKKNIEEGSRQPQLISIEPYPNGILANGLKAIEFLSEIKAVKVQEIDLQFFESLQANDILFIDSTHALKSGGDVWWEYCEILPRLNSGVYVHIHDISLPKPYPQVYFEKGIYWNEQYLLQAFLTYNTRFEIVWAGNYLMTKHPEKIRNSFLPEYDAMRSIYPSSEPSSLWMRVK